MKYVYILNKCFWKDFDVQASTAHSAYASLESAQKVAMTLGLPDSPPDDDGDWYEIERVRFYE